MHQSSTASLHGCLAQPRGSMLTELKGRLVLHVHMHFMHTVIHTSCSLAVEQGRCFKAACHSCTSPWTFIHDTFTHDICIHGTLHARCLHHPWYFHAWFFACTILASRIVSCSMQQSRMYACYRLCTHDRHSMHSNTPPTRTTHPNPCLVSTIHSSINNTS